VDTNAEHEALTIAAVPLRDGETARLNIPVLIETVRRTIREILSDSPNVYSLGYLIIDIISAFRARGSRDQIVDVTSSIAEMLAPTLLGGDLSIKKSDERLREQDSEIRTLKKYTPGLNPWLRPSPMLN